MKAVSLSDIAIRAAIEQLVRARAATEAFMEAGPPDQEAFFDVVARSNAAYQATSAVIANTDDEGFAIAGLTDTGLVRMLTRSAHPGAKWQLTRFDRARLPFNDSEFSDKVEAVNHFLHEVTLDSLLDVEGWNQLHAAA